MRTFRAELSPADINRDIDLQRPSNAPVTATVSAEDHESLYEVGKRLRDALVIPEDGYLPDNDYWSYLALPEESYLSVGLVEGSQLQGAIVPEIPYLARKGTTIAWHQPASEFTVADLTYSQDISLIPATDAVIFRLGERTGGGGGTAPDWIDLVGHVRDHWETYSLILVYLASKVDQIGTEAAKQWVLDLWKNRRKFQENGSERPGDVMGTIEESTDVTTADLATGLGISEEEAQRLRDHVSAYKELEQEDLLPRAAERQLGQPAWDAYPGGAGEPGPASTIGPLTARDIMALSTVGMYGMIVAGAGTLLATVTGYALRSLAERRTL